MDSKELTNYLWEQHQPQQIWMVLAAIGVFTGIALLGYNYLMTRGQGH
jgi:hypothetical protein